MTCRLSAQQSFRYLDVEWSGNLDVLTVTLNHCNLTAKTFNQEYKEQFTDDASVVESLGCQVAMVEGNRENIKITTPFDIKIAEALLG